MDEKEKLKFLRQMGLSVGRGDVESPENKKEKKDTRVDKSDLIALARIFNMHPQGQHKKQQTLTEFLDQEEKKVDNG